MSFRPTEIELILAILSGNMLEVQEYLIKHKKVDEKVKSEEFSTAMSPLQLACFCGQQPAVDLLIHAGADVNLQMNDGESPLWIASQNGHREVVESLIKAQADVNLQTNLGSSPLWIASQNGHCEAVELLIKAQANVNLATTTGSSPLFIASCKGHQNVVDSLIKANADVNHQGNTGVSPIMAAAENNNEKVVESLIKAGANVNCQQIYGYFPLVFASQKGHHRVVEMLIEAQADVNLQSKEGCSALYIASQNGHHQVVDSLIKAHADVNLTKNFRASPVWVASQNGHFNVVISLINAQADVNLQLSTGLSPIYIASKDGHHKVVDALIEAQAVVNLKSKSVVSPLIIASQNGHEKVVELLIKAQADVNHPTKKGESPLLIASSSGHLKIVKLLLNTVADVDLQTSTGVSPLHVASFIGDHKVAKLLIKALADVNIQTSMGDTPLSLASHQGHKKTIEVLIKANAEENYTNTSKKHNLQETPSTPLDSITEGELSRRLHLALTKSGFVDSRAALQAAVADVLQKILTQIIYPDGSAFIVGSYSEGWGNSLVTLDGRIDSDSDIDVMQLIPGRLYHLRNGCKCSEMQIQRSDYKNGHLLCDGSASNPSKPTPGSSIRSAVDEVPACRLCCYPPIAPLLPDRVSRSNIPKSVLQSLEHELTNSPCHVVHAASPEQAGKELRVSTTFLEKRLMRSLSTLQGQLFVTLKYLVKKVVSSKVQGLKSYHVKTATFKLLEETPAEEWKPENLVTLTRRSLQMILDSVESSCSSMNTDGRIMDHFFLCDAALYLKGAENDIAHKILRSLKRVMDKLPSLLENFMDGLVVHSTAFNFHPFLLLPYTSYMQNIGTSKNIHLDYYEIYGVVRKALLEICQEDCSKSHQCLTEMIDKLPVCARSAQIALRVLTCLKFGDRTAAVKVLKDSRGHKVSRGIAWSSERSKTEATEDFVWQHLRSCDSAWKFCFYKLEKRPNFSVLPSVLAKHFPLGDNGLSFSFYLNFDALLQSLRFELTPGDESARDWIRGIMQRDDADVQEQLVAAVYGTECYKMHLKRIRKIKDPSGPVRNQLSGSDFEEIVLYCLQEGLMQEISRVISMNSKVQRLDDNPFGCICI